MLHIKAHMEGDANLGEGMPLQKNLGYETISDAIFKVKEQDLQDLW